MFILENSSRENENLQPSGLEKIVITFCQSLLICGYILRVNGHRNTKSSSFIYQRQLLDHIIVESIEGDDESTNPWRLSQKSRFRECIGLDLAILKRTDGLLLLSIVAVKRAEIQIGRGSMLVRVHIIRAEDIMYDNRR